MEHLLRAIYTYKYVRDCVKHPPSLLSMVGAEEDGHASRDSFSMEPLRTARIAAMCGNRLCVPWAKISAREVVQPSSLPLDP